MCKWIYENCYEEAKKYSCKSQMQRKNAGAYKAAYRNGWLKDYVWMKTPSPSNKKWNYETCMKEAKKYNTYKDFEEKVPVALRIARKNNWLQEYTWLKRMTKPHGFWTYEKCYNEALKYKTKTDFQHNCGYAYEVSLKNGWLNKYDWFPKRKKAESKWKKEICFRIGRKFKTKVEFEKNEKGCYLAAMRNGWLNEMNWFTPAVIEDLERFHKTHCVYVYKDDKLNVAYVGLSSNMSLRKYRHKHYGGVYDYFTSIDKEIPQPIILLDNLTPEESRYYEDFYVKEFKNKGYNVLNKGCTGISCGSFGGGRVKFTKDKCLEIAKKYQYLNDFTKENSSCYNRALRKGWLKEYTWLKRKYKKRKRKK